MSPVLDRRVASPLRFVSLALLGLVPGIPSLAPGQAYVVWQSPPTGAGPASALAAVGDVDGDGTEDLIAGFPYASSAGEARVLSGATGTTLWTLAGTNGGERFGSSVAGVGDWDGDGVPDFAVGTPLASPGGLAGAGRVTVFSGADAGVLLEVNGSAAGDGMGFSAAPAYGGAGTTSAGLVIGSPDADFGGVANVGKVTVLFPGGGGFTAHGDLAYDRLGFSVAPLQSWAVAAGAPQFGSAPCTGGAGYARLYDTSTGVVVATFPGTPPATPTDPLDHFGVSVASPGDLNGDGFGDLVVANRPVEPFACGCSDCGGLAASARAFSGASGYPIALFAADLSYLEVAGAGDVDRDGVADLLMRGSLPCFNPSCGGDSGPEVRLISGFLGTPLFSVAAISGTGAGDVDGDNFPDVAVGDPAPGEVAVLSHVGLPPGSSAFGTGCPGSGGWTPGITASGYPQQGPVLPPFRVHGTNALGGSVALLVLGFSSTSWLGSPLPVNLAPLGMPGCSLFVAPDVTSGTIAAGAGPGGGTASVSFSIPAMPGLSGAVVYLQWYVYDPFPFFPVPASMSRALELHVL